LKTEVNIYTLSTGNLVEGPSFIIDASKTGIYGSTEFTDAGFTQYPSIVPGTSASSCVASITPVSLPSFPHSLPSSYFYNYVISDGSTYSVVANLTLTTTGTISQDSLGNFYDTIVTDGITGTRTYTYLPTAPANLVTCAYGPVTDLSLYAADQRVYPAVAGWNVDPVTSIYLDFDGILYGTGSSTAPVCSAAPVLVPKDGLNVNSVGEINPYWYSSETEQQVEEGRPRFFPTPANLQQYFHSNP